MSVELEECRIGMCDSMDCTGSIIFWIFTQCNTDTSLLHQTVHMMTLQISKMCVKTTHAQTKRSLKTLFMVGTGLSSE